MTSPARRHWNRMTAANADASPAATRANADTYELMQAGLWTARRDLKDIKSIERKIEYKREKALPQFVDYVAGVLEGDSGQQDQVLMTVMVWRFDVGDLAGALTIADYAMAHGLAAPDQYERDTLTIIVDETADRVLEQMKAAEPDAPDADTLAYLRDAVEHARGLVADQDIHDQVMAKLGKAAGILYRALGNVDQALADFKRAVELNPSVGVKKDIERLEREQAKAGKEKNAEDQPPKG